MSDSGLGLRMAENTYLELSQSPQVPAKILFFQILSDVSGPSSLKRNDATRVVKLSGSDPKVNFT